MGFAYMDVPSYKLFTSFIYFGIKNFNLKLKHSSAYFSVWTLTLMAADRFLAVVFPVESMTLR